MDRFFVFVFFYYFSLCLGAAWPNSKLIVVLVDGLRWDYIDDPNLKGIPRIIENGVRAPYVVPVYPSLSYPNYQSIATGLYPENHGFVSNYMYLNDSGKFFGMIPEPGSTDPVWWNGADPVWITAEKNGLASALYWWAGCEVRISDTHPTICERQRFGPPRAEETLDYLERINDVIQLFRPSYKLPKDRLSLAMIYYGAVDYAGHKSGPNSSDVKYALSDIDDILDKMQDKIKAAGLQNEVNIMVVGDHGMIEMKNTKYISLDKYSSKIQHQLEGGIHTMIMPMPGMLDQLYAEIKSDNAEGYNVYKKENIPEEYHLRHSNRMFPLYLTAKKGYFIKALNDQQKFIGPIPYTQIQGTHGYDPAEVEDMRTVFFATGPDFRKGFTTDVLSNVDLYNVMCKILRIEPLPNNGSLDRVEPMLLKKEAVQLQHTVNSSPATTLLTTNICISLLLIGVINFNFLRHIFGALN